MDEDFVEEIIEDVDEPTREPDNKERGNFTNFNINIDESHDVFSKSIPDIDDVVDEVGDVEMPMGETGHKFHEIVLSDDDYDSVVIHTQPKVVRKLDKEELLIPTYKKRNDSIEKKASLFEQRMMNKYSNAYDYKSINSFLYILAKTVVEQHRNPIKDTIEDDEIKEEIDVEDDSEDESPDAKLRQKFIDRLSHNRTSAARQSKTSKMFK